MRRRRLTSFLLLAATLSLLTHFFTAFGDTLLLWWDNRGSDAPLLLKPTQRKLAEQTLDLRASAKAELAGVKPVDVQTVSLHYAVVASRAAPAKAMPPATKKKPRRRLPPPLRVAPIVAPTEPAVPVASNEPPPPVAPVAPVAEVEPVELAKDLAPSAPKPADAAPPAAKDATPDLTPGGGFPKHVRIVYVALGIMEAELDWTLDGDRYRTKLNTKIRNFSLESRGRIGRQGLLPESFVQYEDGEAQPSVFAEFDWKNKTLRYGEPNEVKTAAIEPGIQDFASAPLQFALFGSKMKSYQIKVTSGRNLYSADFQIAGEATTVLDGKEYTSILLRGKHERGNLDIWLTPDLYNLPLRLSLVPSSGAFAGKTIQMSAIQLEIDDKTVIERPQRRTRDK